MIDSSTGTVLYEYCTVDTVEVGYRHRVNYLVPSAIKAKGDQNKKNEEF